MVGAVVVAADGTIVGEGYHQQAGTPHAEVHALDAAGDRARGADAVLHARAVLPSRPHRPVRRNASSRPASRGSWPRPRIPTRSSPAAGFAYLRRTASGRGGVAPRQAARLNAAFFTFMRRARPFVIFKAAVSLDGRIAAAPGERTADFRLAKPQRDTQRLRAEVDAIAVGAGTVLVDDPLLTVRDVYRERPLVARRLRPPPAHATGARLFGTLERARSSSLTAAGAGRDAGATADALERAGARIEAARGHVGRRSAAPARRARRDLGAARRRRGAPARPLGSRYDRSRAAVTSRRCPWDRPACRCSTVARWRPPTCSIAVSNRAATTF